MQLWHLYRTLTISSLIIHRKVAHFQTRLKLRQINVIFCQVTNYYMENRNMPFNDLYTKHIVTIQFQAFYIKIQYIPYFLE